MFFGFIFLQNKKAGGNYEKRKSKEIFSIVGLKYLKLSTVKFRYLELNGTVSQLFKFRVFKTSRIRCLMVGTYKSLWHTHYISVCNIAVQLYTYCQLGFLRAVVTSYRRLSRYRSRTNWWRHTCTVHSPPAAGPIAPARCCQAILRGWGQVTRGYRRGTTGR